MKTAFGLTCFMAIVLCGTALAAPSHLRVRGIVTSISSTALVIHTATGEQTVAIDPTTHFLEVKKSSLSEITPGSFIGTATKSVGPRVVALEVVIFPPAMKGTGEGHYAWDRIKDTTLGGVHETSSSMTNGSVSAVTPPSSMVKSSMTNGSVSTMASHGGYQQLTVTYKGGEQTIIVPPTAPVVMFAPGTMSDVRTGQTVFVNGMSDGSTVTANAVAVGVDGATPPM